MKKSKKYKTRQKSLKARDEPKILKEYSPLLHSEKKQHQQLPNARKICRICDVVVEGKSYTLKKPEAKFKMNKD